MSGGWFSLNHGIDVVLLVVVVPCITTCIRDRMQLADKRHARIVEAERMKAAPIEDRALRAVAESAINKVVYDAKASKW